MRARRQRVGQLAAGLERRRLQCRRLRCSRLWRRFAGCRGRTGRSGHQHVRRQIDAAIGDRRNHRDQLHRRDGNFLADGDGADRRVAPPVHGPQQSARLAGQFDAGPGAESKVANVLVELVRAHLQRQLHRGHVARVLQRLVHRNHAEVVALVVVNHAAGERDLPALAIDHVIGRGHVLIERGRIRHQLERRARFVHVADRMVAQAAPAWCGETGWD